MSAPEMCPLCGSENIEDDDPRPGIAYSCRECGSWFHEVVDA